jgi:lambda repressor-like predicted transcriptional regulator
MSGESAVESKQRYRSQEEVAQVVAEFEASGLTLREFSRQQGIPVGTLNGYRKRQRVGQRKTSKSESLVRVEVSAAGVEQRTSTLSRNRATAGASETTSLTVVLSGGRRIEIGAGFDGLTLGRLISVLEKA